MFYTALEKDPGNKELIIGFEDPCRIKKTYENWDQEEIQRERKILSIPSDFIYHPLPSSGNPNQIEFYAPFFSTLQRCLLGLRNFYLQEENDQADPKIFQKYQYSWILQGSKALSDIHSNDLYHGRLSNGSFYIDEYLKIKIGNIGYSLNEYTYKIHQYYKPPEGFEPEFDIKSIPLINQQQYDVYSFGILMLEILTLKPYYNIIKALDDYDYKKFKELVDDHLNELHEKEPAFESIIKQCIDHDRSKRIKSISLFNQLKEILKDEQYAIDSLQIVKQPLNVFNAMKIVPSIFPIDIQIISDLNTSCTYNDVFQIIRTHSKLVNLFNFSVGSPLVTYSFNQTNFEINYERCNFITISNNEFLKDYTFDCLFTMTLHELLSDFNFIPNETDILSWFNSIQYYILQFISVRAPVRKLSLDSIYVNFGIDKVQLFLFPIGEEESEDVHFLAGWLNQLGILMNEIMNDYQQKINKLNPDKQDSHVIPDISELTDISDINDVQSLISACLSNDDYQKVITTNLLIRINETNKDAIENNVKAESLNIINIFNRLTYLESLPEDDRFKECTKDEHEIMQNLLYSFLDYFLPEECKFHDMDEAIKPFNILRAFYDILYNYELKPYASNKIAEIDQSIAEIKQLNPIVHDFDLSGLQTHLFRQFMITQVPKIMMNDFNHEFLITVNNNNDDDDSNPNSYRFLTLQNVIDFAQESNIEYEKINDNTVCLRYYAC